MISGVPDAMAPIVVNVDGDDDHPAENQDLQFLAMFPLQACCFDDGSCQMLSVADCSASSGMSQGPGTTCEPNLCPQPLEACCFDDGSCQMLTVEDCSAYDGMPQGFGTVCDPNPCPQPPPTQACCFDNGTCQDLTVAECTLAGGAPMGEDTLCATTICDCSYTIGGAIYDDLGNPLTSGVEGVTVTVEGAGGTFTAVTSGTLGLWVIDDVPCGQYTVTSALAGCSFQRVLDGTPGNPPPITITVDADHMAENQSIQFLADCNCMYNIGGAVYDDLGNPLTSGVEGVTITVEGDGGTFATTTAGPSGIWFINDVPCGQYTVIPELDTCIFQQVVSGVPGANPPITIMVFVENQAQNQSIQFLLIDCPPPPTQACCLESGECLDLTVEECSAAGGTPQGEDTICADITCPQPTPVTQACCLESGECLDLTVEECSAAGGTPQGEDLSLIHI